MIDLDSKLLKIADDEHEKVEELLGSLNGIDHLFEVKGRGRKKKPRGVVIEAKEFIKLALSHIEQIKLIKKTIV